MQAFNHGIIETSGDYLVLQHNDTLYIDNVIEKQIKLLEEENYEYITIDKKPPKDVSPNGYDYFPWIVIGFYVKRDFYSKHNIWVDWTRGDNNHLTTITCRRYGIKIGLHLEGFLKTMNMISLSLIKSMDIIQKMEMFTYLIINHL